MNCPFNDESLDLCFLPFTCTIEVRNKILGQKTLVEEIWKEAKRVQDKVDARDDSKAIKAKSVHLSSLMNKLIKEIKDGE